MKKWQIVFSIVLILISIVLYFVHFLIFKDAHHIFIYLLGDIAFIPIEVLLVTLVLQQLLESREKKSLLHKMNMVIGAFFSEVGTPLLKHFLRFDAEVSELSTQLKVKSDSTHQDFNSKLQFCKTRQFVIDINRSDIQALSNFLIEKRVFLLGLLENQNLLEHESFTDLLWAVFHLSEEFSNRKTLVGLPETDYRHLENDIKRAYCYLVSQWLGYLEHLSKAYPHLFSLAIRTNPFDAEASVVIKK